MKAILVVGLMVSALLLGVLYLAAAHDRSWILIIIPVKLGALYLAVKYGRLIRAKGKSK